MRIVLANFGTLGDINPLIGLALELGRRGHTPVLAIPEMFREKIEPLGIGFAPIRPNQDPTDRRMVEIIYDIKRGTERGLREFLFPAIRQSYDDLLAAVAVNGGADLLLSGELAYAGPIVAEVTCIPWASYVLAPFSFFSGYDPPVLPPYPFLARMQEVMPGTGHAVTRFARWKTRHWPEPVFQLREQLGLKRGRSPLFDGKHSPALVLAMFSEVLGQPQPDWPPNTCVTGPVSYDGDPGCRELPADLEAFLAAGPPPLVFTLGSAAVLNAGDFYEQSADAAESLGQRAILLVGGDARNRPTRLLPESILAVAYAPYSQLFPGASVIIHQGGVGTTAQALAAGKPMLVVPYSHDQPDNARRVVHLGVAAELRRKDYSATTAAREIKKLLADPAVLHRAMQLGIRMRAESGVQVACDALEQLVAGPA